MKRVLVLLCLLACKDKEKHMEEVKEIAGNAKEKLGHAKDTVVEAVDKAFETGKAAKRELDKVYQSTNDYALTVDDVGSADRIDKMESIEVNGVRVGYESDSNLTLRGVTYAKHFRAAWKRDDGKVVRVSFYTKEAIDAVAFAQLLAKIVPAVSLVLK